MSELSEAALTYARAGLPIFPLHPRSKMPYGKPKPEEGKPGHFCAAPLHQHGHLDATTDEATVAGWWMAHPDANVGMATGRGLDALDVDGPVGEESLAALVARRWPLPETCETKTGRDGGGRHLYFHSAGWRCTAGVLGPKLDTKGLGGFVLLPPSVHPSGAVYGWTNLTAPAAAPAWLTELLVRKPEPVATFAPRSSHDDDALEQASACLSDMLAAVSGQGGQRALWEAARVMRGFGLTEADVLDLLLTEYNPRCLPPWSTGEIRHTVRGAFTRARRIPEPPREASGRAS